VPTELIAGVDNPLSIGLTANLLHHQKYIDHKRIMFFAGLEPEISSDWQNKKNYDQPQSNSPFDTIQQIVILVQ